MKKPVRATVDWQEPFTPEKSDAPAEVPITKPGRHAATEWVARNHEAQVERRAKVLRDLGGAERDRRRIPPAEFQTSGKTYKSGSQVRFPSAAFRRNYDAIDWRR